MSFIDISVEVSSPTNAYDKMSSSIDL